MTIVRSSTAKLGGALIAAGLVLSVAMPVSAQGYRHQGSREAVRQCSAAAERTASRYSFGGRARVTDIRSVTRKDYGYKVKGRIAVNAMGRSWRHGDPDYGRGWGGDQRGWDSNLRGWDSGTFECRVDWRGRVHDVDFKGIRGIR